MIGQENTTDFSGLAGGKPPGQAYSGVCTVGEATREGEFEKNTAGLQKPWMLPVRKPRAIKPIF
jgi:hypothetical protein